MDAMWFLEGVAADGSHVVHDLDALPVHVGREPGNELVLPGRGLSRRHAQLSEDVSGRLRVTDLNSTNGTFVNRERISGSCLLAENDIIHFGNAEFRLGMRQSDGDADADDSERTVLVPAGRTLSRHFVPLERPLRELLAGRGLSGAIQPIVAAAGGAVVAHELLGRSEHPELPPSPIRLFNLASMLDREAELSRAFRAHGIAALAPRMPGGTLFVNTHPKETFEDAFLASLGALQGAGLDLVVEVHETAVMEVSRMREFAARLKDAGVRFAYDDFGAGQARLNELAEVPAHFVKFDMGLIHDLHAASERKQKMVADLVRLVREVGSVPLAEGVEVEAEAEICRQMGFELIQGYLTGRPVPFSALA
jgi:EAL domain-containing protein (putative c-di-GMP-specific phosphodiesterase class I)